MSAEKYRKDFALSLVNNLPPLPKSPPFPHIAAADVVAGLRDRVNDPHKQDQGAASLCGPAAFFYVLLNFKPELYVQYVIDLFTTGRASIGSLTVEPSHGCRSYNPPPDKISGVDWIALASLRDSENTIMDYSSADDTTSGITRPATFAHWLQAVGCFQGVKNDTNYYFCKGQKEIEAFNHEMDIDRDVCLLVNDNILDQATVRLKSTFCNHWIVVDSINKFDGNQIAIDVYSWGNPHTIPSVGTLSVSDFSVNFYGYVSAAPKYS